MPQDQMKWMKLLSNKRLGTVERNEHDYARDDFQRDFDRIVFSSAFRRLQDKTQVFPLSESDYIRKRLTHSLETSCVGRSLGHMVGKEIIEKYKLKNLLPSHFGSIVASACVAHDIGNPPFGHSGEDAIQHWFAKGDSGSQYLKLLNPKHKNDFLQYEGNAQGFRLLTRLLHEHNKGGLQLTCATLGAFMKYPRASFTAKQSQEYKGVSAKKYGFFDSERLFFEEVAQETGLLRRRKGSVWWCRHPLAFLVEAADDICYRIIDFEDGYRLGHVSFRETEELLLLIDTSDNIKAKLQQILGGNEKIEYLRAKSINKLIHEACSIFMKHEENILKGLFDDNLINYVPQKTILDNIQRISKKHIYSARPVIEIEAAGFDVVGGLLDAFVGSIEDIAKRANKASKRSQKIRQLIPDQFVELSSAPASPEASYARLLKLVDFVSGMTDSYAVSLYKKITGISLPNG